MRGAVGLARRARVPPVVVALTVVGLGTSLPELVVSVRASLAGYPSLALGNVVGSNIVNVLVVAGAAAVVFPLRTRDAGIRRSGTTMMVASLLFAGLCVAGRGLSRVDGLVLLAVLAVAAAVTVLSTARTHQESDVSTPIEWVLGLPSRMPTILLFIAIGLVVLPLGADFLVDAAVQIAERRGVSETVIGLTVVAVGTSLPELATTLMAALRGKTGMVVGTVVGSNIFNALAIMGAAATLSRAPVSVAGRVLSLDVPVMLAAAGVLTAFIWLRRPIRRAAGVSLLAAYLAYLLALLVTA